MDILSTEDIYALVGRGISRKNKTTRQGIEKTTRQGIEMLLYPLNAKLVKNTTKLTMEVAARLGDYIVTIQLIIIIRALS